MCKLIAITDASRIKNLDAFVGVCMHAVKDMTDGFGYAVQTNGGVAGYRTLNPELHTSTVRDIPPFVEVMQHHYGVRGEVTGPMILHGRISTNHNTLRNTHPIVREDWHLVHNGVVTNHGPAYGNLTTNDSEHVLYHLMRGINEVADNLTGYYAAAAIDNEGKLHIVRDSIATLYYARLNSVDSGIFATTPDIIYQVAAYLGDVVVPLPVMEDVYLVFEKNILQYQTHFKSRGYGHAEAAYATRSLGRELYNSDDGPYYTDAFWDEIAHIDETWIIMASQGHELTVEQFYDLTDKEKMDCTIIRPNGTELRTWENVS